MTDLIALVLHLAGGLEAAGIPYALGGALSLNFWSDPRATRDIDLNLFLHAEEARPAFESLRDLGVDLDPDAAVERARERGDAVGWMEGVRIDFFVNSIPLHELAVLRRRRVVLQGQPIWVLSPEDLMVLKFLFFRGKDMEDCKRMMALQGDALDAVYVKTQLVAHVGEEDSRVGELDAMLVQFRPPPLS